MGSVLLTPPSLQMTVYIYCMNGDSFSFDLKADTLVISVQRKLTE